MKSINIRAVRTTEIEFKNALEGEGRIDIGTSYSYNVRYGQNNVCRGEFTATVNDKNDPDKFHIKLTCVGIMSLPEGMTKEDAHRASYEALFPYVRAQVTGITAGAGIPPIYIPFIDISGQEIYRIEIPRKN